LASIWVLFPKLHVSPVFYACATSVVCLVAIGQWLQITLL